MYVQLVMRKFAASENFNPSMNNDELLYTAQQFTREGLTEGVIPEKEASGLCDMFAIKLRTLVDKTLEWSPAAFKEQNSTLATSFADLDTPMNGNPARASPDADSPMSGTQGTRASPLFVYPASSGLALQQEWGTPFPRHPATFSSPTNNAQPTSGSGTSKEDEVEMELELLESRSRERGKTRSPECNRFNVRAHIIN